jgi:hypothetical protein
MKNIIKNYFAICGFACFPKLIVGRKCTHCKTFRHLSFHCRVSFKRFFGKSIKFTFWLWTKNLWNSKFSTCVRVFLVPVRFWYVLIWWLGAPRDLTKKCFSNFPARLFGVFFSRCETLWYSSWVSVALLNTCVSWFSLSSIECRRATREASGA